MTKKAATISLFSKASQPLSIESVNAEVNRLSSYTYDDHSLADVVWEASKESLFEMPEAVAYDHPAYTASLGEVVDGTTQEMLEYLIANGVNPQYIVDRAAIKSAIAC